VQKLLLFCGSLNLALERGRHRENAVRLKHAEPPTPWGCKRAEAPVGSAAPGSPKGGAAPAKKPLGSGWGAAKSWIIPSSMDWSSPRLYTGSCTTGKKKKRSVSYRSMLQEIRHLCPRM